MAQKNVARKTTARKSAAQNSAARNSAAPRQQASGGDAEKRHEAENLAKEALQALDHGDKDEGKFLAKEARELDPRAAATVLKEQDAKTAHSGAHAGKSPPPGERHHAAERSTDHDQIRAWVEERNGRPSVVKRSHDTGEGGGILRIDFDQPEASLEEISWDEFFETFEDRELAFLYQEQTADGDTSRFFKFVRRDEEDEPDRDEEDEED